MEIINKSHALGPMPNGFLRLGWAQVLVLVTVLVMWGVSLNAFASPVKVTKSFICESVSANLITGQMQLKNKKEQFDIDDKSVSWAGEIKGGFMKSNRSDYSVNWYKPDGSLYEGCTPSFVLIDCSQLKSSIALPENITGLWKVEVVYDKLIIDEKYFTVSEGAVNKVSQPDIDLLESKINRDNAAARDIEGAEKIRSVELVTKILSDLIDDRASKDVLNSSLEVRSGDGKAAKGDDGVFLVSTDFSKVYFKCKFVSFFGASQKPVTVYWLSPKNELLKTSSSSIAMMDEVSFPMERDDPFVAQSGAYRAIMYIKDKKCLELKFLFSDRKIVDELLGQQEAALKAKEYAEVQKETVRRTGAPKMWWDIKKGYTKEQLVGKWGQPERVINISEAQCVWIYWEPGSGDSWLQDSHAINGDLVGGLFVAAISPIVDSAFELGHVFGVYLVNGIVEDRRTLPNVSKNEVKNITIDRFRERILGVPVTKEWGKTESEKETTISGKR